MGQSTYKHFNAAKKYLIAHLELETKIQVRRTNVPQDCFADCNKKGGKFVIRINNTLHEDVAILFLVHELGHVLAWNKDGSDHGPNWGKCYAAIYRRYLDFLEHA